MTSSSTSPLFLLFGSGPGIGLSLATAFALKHFSRLALCARNAASLEREREKVLAAAKAAGREVEVLTFVVDLNDLSALKGRLEEVERVCGLGGETGGRLGCVWHNAASVRFSEPLGEGMDLVEGDMKTNALSLYSLAQWAIPLLLNGPSATHPPSFMATSSHLPETPLPPLLPLSMAKAAQQNLVLGLHEAFGSKMRFGLVKVCGLVREEDEVLNPTNIAEGAVEFWAGGFERGTMLRIP